MTPASESLFAFTIIMNLIALCPPAYTSSEGREDRQGARGEGQGARGKGQGARGKGRGARVRTRVHLPLAPYPLPLTPYPFSEHVFESQLHLSRVHARARNHAEIGRPELRSRLAPERQVGQVENFHAELEVVGAHGELLVDRRVEARESRPDQRIALDGPVAEW